MCADGQALSDFQFTRAAVGCPRVFRGLRLVFGSRRAFPRPTTSICDRPFDRYARLVFTVSRVVSPVCVGVSGIVAAAVVKSSLFPFNASQSFVVHPISRPRPSRQYLRTARLSPVEAAQVTLFFVFYVCFCTIIPPTYWCSPSPHPSSPITM